MAADVVCPRCGSQVATGGQFCPRCGRYLTPTGWGAPMVWVAIPPPLTDPPLPRPPRQAYAGPPRHTHPPRGGFPPAPWAAEPVIAPARLLPPPVALLWATAAVATVAACAEIWRYVLLLASRSDALDAHTVALSDALVGSAGTVTALVGLLAGALLVRWTVGAAGVAARSAGVVPARSARAIVAGWLVPVLDLAVPGSTLAEIEHCALERPPGERPRPSRLLLAWWVLWVADLLLAAAVLVWSWRTGVQARADGVVLHAVLDAIAAVTAGVTAVVIARLTRLLLPTRVVRREVVVAVRGAPHPAG